MLGLVLALALQVPPAPLTASQIDLSAPLALAPRLLPQETLAVIEGGEVWRVRVPGQMYGAQFWEAPRPGPDGFCSRRVHRVELGKFYAPGDPEPTTQTPLVVKDLGPDFQYALAWPRPATEATCAGISRYIPLRPATLDAELTVLTRLTEAMSQARADGSLPFELSCVSDIPATCDTPRAALANLPLEALFLVRLNSRRYPQSFTDGRWPEAYIEFSRSGDDGRSWIVGIKGVDRVERIEMRRTTIIRH